MPFLNRKLKRDFSFLFKNKGGHREPLAGILSSLSPPLVKKEAALVDVAAGSAAG